MEAIESFEVNGRTVKIYHDEDAEGPREYDNLATLACWHRRSNLGDEQISGMTAKELIRDLRSKGEKVLALLPLYLYQHSGMTMSTTPFSCRFDSGQVGWAYVTKSSAEKMGCVGDRWDLDPATTLRVIVGKWDKAALEDAIRGEVSSYDDFLAGRCYGYVVEGRDGDELESCWGFVGDLNYVRSEARSAAEHSTDPAIQRNADELEARATYAAGAP